MNLELKLPKPFKANQTTILVCNGVQIKVLKFVSPQLLIAILTFAMPSLNHTMKPKMQEESNHMLPLVAIILSEFSNFNK